MKRYKVLIGLLIFSAQLFFLVPHILGAPAPMPSQSPAPTGTQPSPIPSSSPSSSSCPVFHPQTAMISIPIIPMLSGLPGYNLMVQYDDIVSALLLRIDKPLGRDITAEDIYDGCHGNCIQLNFSIGTDTRCVANNGSSITETTVVPTYFYGPNNMPFVCNTITTVVWAYNQETNELSRSEQDSWNGTCFSPFPPTGSSTTLVNTLTGEIIGTTSSP